MVTKATALFFILFGIAHLESVKIIAEKQKHVSQIFDSITDISLSNKEAFEQTIDKVNDLLGVDLTFDSKNSMSQNLADAFSLQGYINNEGYKPAKMDAEEIEKRSNEILANFPTFEKLFAEDSDLEHVAAAAIEKFNDAGNEFIKVLHQGVIYELHDQLSNGKDKFVFTRHEQTKVLLNGLIAKTREIGVKILEKGGKSIAENIKSAGVEINSKYKAFYGQIHQSVKALAAIFLVPEQTFSHVFMSIFYQTAAKALPNENGASSLPETAELKKIIDRLGFLSQVLGHYIVNLKDSLIHRNYNQLVNLQFTENPENKQLMANSQFSEFLNAVLQDMLDAMIPFAPAEEIRQLASYGLTMPTDPIYESAEFSKIVTTSYESNPFQNANKATSDNYRASKLRNFYYLVYIPADVLGEERFKSLINDFGAVNTFDLRRRNLLIHLSGAFASPSVSPSTYSAFLGRFFDITVECAAFAPEEMLNNNPFEILDYCIDKHVGDSSFKNWFENNWLSAKLLNLFFFPQTSEYQTTFATYDVNDNCGQVVFNFFKTENFIKENIQHLYQQISGDFTSTYLNTNKVVGVFSGKTLPANMFSRIQSTDSTEVVTKSLDPLKQHKIDITFVKNQLPAGKSPSQNKNRGEEKVNPLGLSIPVDDGINPDLKITPIENVPLGRIQVGLRENLVNEIIGRLPEEQINSLKTNSVDEFIKNHDLVVTQGGTETTYVFVKVTRRQSPCHPQAGNRC